MEKVTMVQIEVDVREKVKSLLRELFQFDNQDLDFGIHRIMNFKRNEISRFIETDLIVDTEKQFIEFSQFGENARKQELEQLKREIIRDFGVGTIDEEGFVRKNEDAPKIKEYLKKVEELKEAQLSEVQINDVFNLVYEFFSRYYDKGDFLCKPRYGGKEKYYLPYNGEEVILHWANDDQYYIKTDEYFRNYSFKSGLYSINFLLRQTEYQINNNVGQEKYFFLGESDFVTIDEQSKIVQVFIQYGTLTEDDKKRLGNQSIQELLVSEAVERLSTAIGNSPVNRQLAIKGDKGVTVLENHLINYVRRNKTDYFIHKNLKPFLERELDFYIKNEVLSLEDIQLMDKKSIDASMAKIKAVRGISQKIIDFLGQIEDFQKTLFEKKKFVINTDYVITLDRINKYTCGEFTEIVSDEIMHNSKQLGEWNELFGTIIKNKSDLIDRQTIDGKEWKRYPLDTRYFSQEFKIHLLNELAKNNNLEEILDGTLLNSENFQALRLLEKYKERLKCIYIDPPYNTGNDDFLYKDNFQHSCWMSMMNDRLRQAFDLLHPSGSIGVSIDNNELDELLKILDLVFQNRRTIVTVKRGSVTGPKVINPGVVNVAEYLVIYSKNTLKWQPNRVYREKKRDTRYNNFIINREKDPSEWKFISLLQAFADQKGIPRQRCKEALGKQFEKQLDQFAIDNAKAIVRTAALDDDKISKDARELKKRSKENPQKIYHFQREKFEDWFVIGGERILFYSDRLVQIGNRLVQGELITDIWDDTLPNDLHNEGGVTLRKGKKPEKLVGRFIDLTTDPGDFVIDFFAGTGTACAAAQKMGRKWIGIDMATFFDSHLVKRLKNTLYGEQSGISPVTNWKGGGFFKYQTIEQYEDTLNNIILVQNKMVQETLDGFNDYFLKYVLDFESRNSPTRLNAERFQNPSDYKIMFLKDGEKVLQNVDLVETFNYLLGLTVEKIQFLKDSNSKVEYEIVTGKRETEKLAIIWRNSQGLDLERDRVFIRQVLLEAKIDRVFINGDSYVENALPIELELKRLMGA
jgi:adenine-specific DNA-methyltransferase